MFFCSYVGNSKIINPKLKKQTANSTKKPFCKKNANVLQRMQSVSYILSITYDTFCVFAFLRFDFHHRNAASLGIVQVNLTLRSLLCILMFHHRNAASLGITQVNLALRSLLRILMFHHRNATSLGITQINLTLRSLLRILQNGIIK
jgi:hypothetical protein